METYYVADRDINHMLNLYVHLCSVEEIAVSVDAEGLAKGKYSAILCAILEILLCYAKDNCLAFTERPDNRYVRLKCKFIQKKIFIKICFACEDQNLLEFDPQMERVREIVEEKDGYFKVELAEDEGCIKVAVSTFNRG